MSLRDQEVSYSAAYLGLSFLWKKERREAKRFLTTISIFVSKTYYIVCSHTTPDRNRCTMTLLCMDPHHGNFLCWKKVDCVLTAQDMQFPSYKGVYVLRNECTAKQFTTPANDYSFLSIAQRKTFIEKMVIFRIDVIR